MEEKEVKKSLRYEDWGLTHSMVHYLITIHKLKEENGYARVTDIARTLNFTKGSVSTALNALKKKKLIQEDQQKFLSLTEHSHSIVHRILTARSLMFYFLKDCLEVQESIALKDSCSMEHLMSEETMINFFRFMKKNSPKDNPLTTHENIDELIQMQKGDCVLKD